MSENKNFTSNVTKTGTPEFEVLEASALVQGLKDGKTLQQVADELGEDPSTLITRETVKKRLAELGFFAPVASEESLKNLAALRLAQILLTGEDRDANQAIRTIRGGGAQVQVNVLSDEIKNLEIGEVGWEKK